MGRRRTGRRQLRESTAAGAAADHPDSANAATPTFVLEKGRFATNLFVPGELIAFQQVDLYAKVNSFVKKLYVDVGSEVREGRLAGDDGSARAPKPAVER